MAERADLRYLPGGLHRAIHAHEQGQGSNLHLFSSPLVRFASHLNLKSNFEPEPDIRYSIFEVNQTNLPSLPPLTRSHATSCHPWV